MRAAGVLGQPVGPVGSASRGAGVRGQPVGLWGAMGARAQSLSQPHDALRCGSCAAGLEAAPARGGGAVLPPSHLQPHAAWPLASPRASMDAEEQNARHLVV